MNDNASQENNKWYAAGLCFQCTQCGDCCTGDPGYVWVNDKEIAALAKKLGFSTFMFEQQFVRRVGKRKSLVELTNGDCVLFDPKKRCCRVYEERPIQCKTWPFWDMNIATEEDWRDTVERCPGCNNGPLFPAEEIERQAKLKS